uniref:Putative reverse transcriptase domain, viral movement protein n=1 Tax=Tanacetum cinerariifolium TaxID=118510 RepID=A0A6L2JYZ9_TANCI|nr:putative reverse transcriptase domain, viral movement protein [Tanacetum cinerariifolium]
MLTWCTAKLQYYTIDVVIKRFFTRIQGRLRDCPWEHTAHAREEFLKMKCCSFQKKDLEKHYDRINEAYWALEARNVTIAQTTLGELYQLILNALAKLCNQKKFLAEFERTRKCLGIACDDRYLQIKCKDKSSCDCTHTKKKFHSKRFSSLSGKPRFSRQNNKKWKFIRKKKKRVAKHLTEPVDVSDLEFLYSLDDEPSDSVLCTIVYSDLSFDDDSDIDSLEGDSDFGVHMISLIPSFFNPWTAMHRLFVASITPPIFNINNIKQRLIQTCCASSHTEFLTKHPSPLWLNPSFFVSLPFKQNEDVNPTKASHPKMNPDHYQLAKEECEQLVSQRIIEPTTSPWACKAFYVNKRSEQVHGKLRLVINYQPLNYFLADDKFPLPQKKSLFQHLADARVLSKFDLKSGFWQLGIKPEDRTKTAFCIPNHHYQWNVMPFGLKKALSAFQKAMITIFEPILANTLVYIDDILLLSSDEQSHAELLSKFYSLVTKYEIMLSEKNMEVGVTTIQFLDFLPKLSHHTAWLFPMLKKNPSQWTSKQTEAVKAIKSLAEKMPPLKIHASLEKRILQTDASDKCWGAVLLVQDNNNKRHVCGYKSGMFKASEKHCHSTFKEILAVKRGIEKFQFHLIGHEFPKKLLSYVVKSQFKDVPPYSKHLLTMLQWPGSFLPPKAVNDDGFVVYHAPYYFIYDWYKVNPSSRRCERKLQTLYTDTKGLMARANGVDPDKIPYHVMWNISIWSEGNSDAYRWIKANGQWLYENFDHCKVETSDDDDDARSLWSSDDEEHFDPFEDDPTHPDARWSP